MFWSKNKKYRYFPVYPSFAVLKWGIKGYTFHGHVLLMCAFVFAYVKRIFVIIQLCVIVETSMT